MLGIIDMREFNRDQMEKRFAYDHREFVRGRVTIGAKVRIPGGGRHQVQIIDLSQSGFRMESLTALPDNTLIYVTIPGLAQLECRVAWKTEWHYGCSFEGRLHPAVYDHIVKLYPSLASLAS